MSTPSPALQRVLDDPEFRKLPPSAQVEVLRHMNLMQPPETAIEKMGRGGALGFASGLGIPEAPTSKEVVVGAAKQFAGGVKEAGRAIGTDIVGEVRRGGLPTLQPTETQKLVTGVLKGGYEAGAESLRGIKESDPEEFAHGLGSLLGQIVSLGATRGEVPGETAVRRFRLGEEGRLNKLAAALDVKGDEVQSLKTAMPRIVDQAGKAGVTSVGELHDVVQKARGGIDQEFNAGLAPIRNRPYIPLEISRRIRGLITSDMAKTAAGRAEIKAINKAAKEYEKPWTIGELNDKRATENKNLSAARFYEKGTRAQVASPLDTDISKAVRDGAADIVYDQWDRANPGRNAELMKRQQGSLWHLSDYLAAKVEDLEAGQRKHAGVGAVGRLKPHVYLSRGAGAHGYVSGVAEALSGGPGKEADVLARRGFGIRDKSKVARTIPLAHLVEPYARGGLTPPPKTEDQE